MWTALVLAGMLAGGEIRGRVTDGNTGEPLGRAVAKCGEVSVQTDAGGRFAIAVEGECDLRVAAIGYRPVTVRVGAVEIDVRLIPDTLRTSESVTVAAGPYAREEAQAVGLQGSELRNLASVLADDPMRAMQALPNVTSQDDYQAQFAVRAASPQRIGMYLDGVLLHNPFHTLQGEPTSASLTALEGELIEAASLHPGPAPVRFSDRTGGAIDFRTRETGSKRTSGRVTASASNAGASAEGTLGQKGWWLAAVRKSYLQYLIERTTDDPTIAFGFWDAQGKLAWNLGPHQLGLTVVDGHSGLGRNLDASRTGVNSYVSSGYHLTLATAYHRWSGRALTVDNRGGYLQEKFTNLNRMDTPLLGGRYGEWLWNGDAQWAMRRRSVLEFGGVARRLRDQGFRDRIVSNTPLRVDDYRGTAARTGAYVQESIVLGERVRLSAGGRVDHHSVNGRTALSPYASAAWDRFTLTWSQAVQYPELSRLLSRGGRPDLLEERSSQVQLTAQQPLGDRARLRVELYDRIDRDLLFQPWDEPRLVNGKVYNPPLVTPWENSQRAYSRGVQLMLQRRAANGLTGWVTYGFGQSRVRDGAAGVHFTADYDLRHIVRAFGSRRITPTVSVSGKFAYGTGTILRGFFEQRGEVFYLSGERNALRLPSYQRTDMRINKAFVKDRVQFNLFVELINITNHENPRYSDLNGYNPQTGQARLSFDRMFPILPSAGLVMDF